MGHPILGDATYATAANATAADIPRMCLHAHSLRLRLAPREAAALKGAPSKFDGDEAAAAAAATRTGEAGAATEAVVAPAGTAGGTVAAAGIAGGVVVTAGVAGATAGVAGATATTGTAVERERRTALKRKGRPSWRAGVRGGGADGEGTIFEMVAPDPFVFVDGELQL